MSSLVGDIRPSSWPQPNYVDPETRTSLMLGVLITCAVLVLVVLGGRLFAKAHTKGSIALDDWLMTASAVMIIGVDILGCVHTIYGAGYHIWDVPAGWDKPWGKISLASYVVFVPSVSLTKISLCVTYLRLFPSRLNKWFCLVTIAFLILWSIAVIFLFCFACSPIAAFWDPKIRHPKCIDIEFAFIISAAINSLTDFTVFLWPVRTLWSVQLPLQTRLSLIFFFGIGSCVCTAGILRAWYVSIYFTSTDPFYKSAILWVILAVEGNFGIICGCLPPLKPALKRLFPGSSAWGHSTEILNMYANDKRREEAFAFRSLGGGCAGVGKEGLAGLSRFGRSGGESSLDNGSEEWLGTQAEEVARPPPAARTRTREDVDVDVASSERTAPPPGVGWWEGGRGHAGTGRWELPTPPTRPIAASLDAPRFAAGSWEPARPAASLDTPRTHTRTRTRPGPGPRPRPRDREREMGNGAFVEAVAEAQRRSRVPVAGIKMTRGTDVTSVRAGDDDDDGDGDGCGGERGGSARGGRGYTV